MAEGSVKTKQRYNRFGGYHAYEPAYNVKVHGPYYPWVHYGTKPRASMWDVKIGHIGSHFSQADTSFVNIRDIISKSIHRWCYKKHAAKKIGMRGLYQAIAFTSFLLFLTKFPQYAAERRVKYHW